jgi:hypothetical protein
MMKMTAALIHRWKRGFTLEPARGLHTRLMLTVAIAFIIAGPQPLLAQQATVQPMQGQTPEQMQQDMTACQSAATEATGFSPSQPPLAAAPAGPSGKRLRGAAAGAVAGAVRAEARGSDSDAWDEADEDRKQDYRQEEAQSSARAGAAVGGMATRADRRQGRRQQGQEQQQASAWNQAYNSCLQGRGYTVTP